jgi:hypothetical protein
MNYESSGRRCLTVSPTLKDIFVALEAADIDAIGVNINNMTNMQTIFDVGGEGSSAMIENLVVENNDLSQVEPKVRWTGLNIRENAKATVVNSTIANNTNIRHVFSASSSSSMDIQGALVTMASGGRVVVSRVQLSVHVNTLIVEKLTASSFCRIQWM